MSVVSRRNFGKMLFASTALTPLTTKRAHAVWWIVAGVALRWAVRGVARKTFQAGTRALASGSSRVAAKRYAGTAAGSSVAIKSGKAVAKSEKKAKGALPLTDRAKRFAINQAADVTADAVLDMLISQNGNSFKVNPDAPIIGVDVRDANGETKFLNGDVVVTLNNVSDKSVGMEVSSYVYDLDDEHKQYIGFPREGVAMAARDKVKWEASISKDLYAGRKVIVTEIQHIDTYGKHLSGSEIVNVTEPFYVPA